MTHSSSSPESLPKRPNLRKLKDMAKQLLRGGDAESLVKAQFRIARRYGFASWPKLQTHVLFQNLVSAIRDNQTTKALDLLDDKPDLALAPEDDTPTALHWAAYMGNEPVARRLISLNADLNRKENLYGALPIGWANENNQRALVDLLKRKGAKVDLSRAAMIGDLARIKEILREDPGAARRVDPDEWHALVQAAGWGFPDIVRCLLDHGADINVQTVRGYTPLHACAGWEINGKNVEGRIDMVRLLLDKGADSGLQDVNDKTPVDLAREHNADAIVELLNHHGGGGNAEG